MSDDRHNTKKLSLVLATIVSAIFFAIGVAGYQRTGDVIQLVVFLGVSALSFMVVVFIFKGIDRLLDAVDDRLDGDK